MAMASPPAPGKTRPVRAESGMYAAQAAAASSDERDPRRSSPEAPNGFVSSRIPAAASTTHARSSARRESATASPSGPANSIVTATPIGMRSMAE